MRNLIFVAALAVACSGAASAAPAKKTPAKKSSAPTVQKAAPAIYYDFKGIRLGMTRDEVKAIPLEAEGSGFDKSPITFWCSDMPMRQGQKLGGFYLSKAETALGVVECKYAQQSSLTSNDYVFLSEARVKVGDWMASNVSFSFLDGRLYKITIDGHKNMLGDVLEGLTAKFGQPTSKLDDTTQNKAGATFPHIERIWANRAATVKVEAPYTRIDNMNVLYLTADGTARVNAKDKELSPAASKM